MSFTAAQAGVFRRADQLRRIIQRADFTDAAPTQGPQGSASPFARYNPVNFVLRPTRFT